MGELHCKLVPNARKSEILGWEADAAGRPVLKIRLAAPPLEGKANRALVEFLSAAIDVPKGSLALVQGERSRTKRIRVDGLDQTALAARIDRLIAGDD